MKMLPKILLVIILFLSISIYNLPWKTLIEERLKDDLASRGFSQLEFSVESVSLKEIAFKDIVLGELKLPNLSINYTPMELWSGRFRNIRAGSMTFNKDKLKTELHNIDFNLESKQWKIDKITIDGAPFKLSPLAGKGVFNFVGSKIYMSGDIYSANAKTNVKFNINYQIDDSKSTKLTIISAKLPWSDGTLSAHNILVSLYETKPISINLKVNKVSLNSLLAAATSDRASATGNLSGNIPIIISHDGSFTINKGMLKADKEGTLVLSPDVIPSDAAQVTLLRDVLKNFHYSAFSMGIKNANSKELSMLLSIEGNNPDMYNGRAIKLNVNLTGDVMDLISNTMLIINN